MLIRKFDGKSNVIGKNVKKYRELRNMSQREFSNQLALLGLDIHHSAISDIENEKTVLKDFEIIAFCKVLNVSYEQLFENTDSLFE